MQLCRNFKNHKSFEVIIETDGYIYLSLSMVPSPFDIRINLETDGIEGAMHTRTT